MSFDEVLRRSRAWLLSVRPEQDGTVSFDVLTDTDDALRVIMETPQYMAELLTVQADFAPYRFVSFCVYSTDKNASSEPVFCYFDNDDSTADELLNGLNEGMRLMTNM